MAYLVFTFKVHPAEPGTDILMAELDELGFYGFTEDEKGVLKAYIAENDFDSGVLKSINLLKDKYGHVEYTRERIPDKNWNEIWENNFTPIRIGSRCLVRAGFHPRDPEADYDILIHPRMAFGTGHHATTLMMIEEMLDMDFTAKDVLDMGCGTGVLAILARKMGAGNITAVDVDDWAVENSRDNFSVNDVDAKVLKGDAGLLNDKRFNVILANINTNVLLSDIPVYFNSLKPQGELLLSGFMTKDAGKVRHAADKAGMKLLSSRSVKDWMMHHFIK